MAFLPTPDCADTSAWTLQLQALKGLSCCLGHIRFLETHLGLVDSLSRLECVPKQMAIFSPSPALISRSDVNCFLALELNPGEPGTTDGSLHVTLK